MAFSSGDLTKLAAKALAANVISSNHNKQWYEASLVNNTVVDSGSVWAQMTELRALSAPNIAGCVSKAFDNPEIMEAFGYDSSGAIDDTTAVQLTPVTGTLGHDWLLTETFGDLTSTKRNIISPTQIPQASGRPSSGYSVRLFKGVPSLGNEIITVEGFDGNEVGWFFSAANSLAMFADDTKPDPSEAIYAVGFQYVGQTGGGSGVSGNNIVLEDPDGRWRINASSGSHLEFERWDTEDGIDYKWVTWFKVGASCTTDGVILTRPYDLSVDFNENALNTEALPDLYSVFKVSGVNKAFTYGNSTQSTVFETKRGEEVQRADTVREAITSLERPLTDKTITIDRTLTPTADSVTDFTWKSGSGTFTTGEYIRTTHVGFEVLDASIAEGVPLRFSVEELDGTIIQENITVQALNAGVKPNLTLTVGDTALQHFSPTHKDKADARFQVRMTIPAGERVVLSAGEYEYTEEDGTVITQLAPRLESTIEYVNHVDMLDESNLKELVHRNTGVILDNGIHSYDEKWSNRHHQLVGVGEHVTSEHAVLGNYESRTYIATGTDGLNVLYQDDATRTKFWTQGLLENSLEGDVPTHTIETSKITLPLSDIFTEALKSTHDWKLVNVETFEPLLRYEGNAAQSYRVSISSDLVDHRFQENMNKYELADKLIKSDWILPLTTDPINPEYAILKLPRKGFTVGDGTPRTITYEFQEPVRLYGHYIDPTDASDPTTGTFIPRIRAEVYRVLEQPVVSGNELAERVDTMQGQMEWDKATQQTLGSLHIDHANDLALADEDGEWLLFFSEWDTLNDDDVHQWIMNSGMEAYYEQDNGSMVNGLWTAATLTVHVPYESVKHFDVTLVNPRLSGRIQTHKVVVRTYDQDCRDLGIDITIPEDSSVRYTFTKRRDGEYSYYAIPFNDTLASTVTRFQGEPELLPVNTDPNPPIVV